MASPLVVTTPLGPGALSVTGFSGTEAISQLFSYELDLVAENATAVPFEQVVGQPISLSMALPGGGRRFFHGIVSRLSQGRRDATFTSYRAEVVPWLWLLTRRQKSRIFQRLSVPQILQRLFAGAPSPGFTMELAGTYPVRNYCVQYRETDFDFASRLMEEEGIYYFFRHSDDGHHLVVADSNAAFRSVPTTSTVTFSPTAPTKPDTTTVLDWEKSQELRSGLVTLRDHDFELPDETLEARHATPDAVRVGVVTHHLAIAGNDHLELYDFPGGYAKKFDGVGPGGGDDSGQLAKIQPEGNRLAAVRMQQEAVMALRIDGLSNCRQFTAGHAFALKGHFDGNGKYYLTSVTHRSTVSGDPRRATQTSVSYHNTFAALPAGMSYRGTRSPTPSSPPRVPAQTAVVVGPVGAQVFTDKYGRVKVQFHWDREGKNDSNSSCWVRVGALHAGEEHGFVPTPVIGQEVVVAFLEGDPDQPIIVGSVYNADRPPPPTASDGGG